MAVPSIAFYAASPPSSICSNAHSCQPNSHSPSDYECKPNTRNPSNSSQRSAIGGLSCLFSSHSVKHTSSMSFAGDDELSSSFSYSSYSPLSASVKCGDPSPTSVFHGSISCGSSSRSPSLRNARSFNGDSSPSSSLKMNRGLFSGCVRNALGSCIDFDSPICDSSTGLDDEFTFNLEENMREMSFEPYASKMLKRAQAKHQIFYDEFVIKAFYEAEKAHRGQLRASGDPYLQHCVETGVLLAIIGANSIVVASGLLHDTLDDSIMNYDYLFHTFGAGVADLVEGVSKLSQLSKLARDNNTAYKTEEADRLHTMFLAMADARAVLIKLADRLHNMMTLEALSIEKQQRFAKETLEIFVPLANRLGISTWKEQLENLCFKHLHPKEYSDLSSRLVESYDETPIKTAIEKLKSALKDEGLSYHLLSGRHKSLYSIYSKMLKKGLVMDQIHDIYGLRLIVDNTKDCYTALSIIRRLWPEIVGKFKDYIIHPKFNGYQSLHTVVMGEGILPLEVQIRTKDMHLQAEFGFAAHWRYKEGDCKYSSFVLQMVEWARWIVTWQCKTMDRGKIWTPCPLPAHLQDCPHSCVPSLEQDGPIFIVMVGNEKMSIKELPANTTVIDLLEAIKNETPRWSPYGFAMTENLRPRLNQEPVKDLSCRLKMGDMVELTPVTSNKSLTEYREEIQRMYNYDLMAASSPGWKRSYF